MADTADDAQTEEGGESQRATALRNTLEARLRAECAEFAEAAEAAEAAGIALADQLQFREVLGQIER